MSCSETIAGFDWRSNPQIYSSFSPVVAGSLVSREELRLALWPEDTFVDFDHGLNNCIRRIREALGDSADSSRFIETLPKKGYRFIGETSTIGLPQVTSAPPQESMPEELAELKSQAMPQSSSLESPPRSGHSLIVEKGDGPHHDFPVDSLASLGRCHRCPGLSLPLPSACHFHAVNILEAHPSRTWQMQNNVCDKVL